MTNPPPDWKVDHTGGRGPKHPGQPVETLFGTPTPTLFTPELVIPFGMEFIETFVVQISGS